MKRAIVPAAGGEVALPLGVSSPRMSLIGWPRRTLDCRHGEAVLAVEPGARRREYPFSGSSRRPPCLARERDGDVASTMRGIGRASEGDRGLPADCVRPKGSIGVGAVPDHDAGPFGAVAVAGRGQAITHVAMEATQGNQSGLTGCGSEALGQIVWVPSPRRSSSASSLSISGEACRQTKSER